MTAVIFDCDGTLVDSEPLSFRAWERVLARYGHALMQEEMDGFLGSTFAKTHAHWAERLGLPDASAFWPEYSHEAFRLIDTELVTFPDALAALSGLKAAGVAVAVASSSPRQRLDRTLSRAGLEAAFAVSVAGDEIEHSKPAPDIFLAAAERLGRPAGECIVVEDSPTGVSAGLAAGMTTVAVSRTPTHRPLLVHAHRLVDALSAEAILGSRA